MKRPSKFQRVEANAKINAQLSTQHGLITRQQALDAGLSRSAIEWRLSTRMWVPVHHEVYRVASAPQTHLQKIMAATLAGGEGAVVSQDSAAALWGFPGFQLAGPYHVTIPRSRDHTVDGVIAHEARKLQPVDVTRLYGIPITTADRTAFDLAWKLASLDLLDVIDHITRECSVTAARIRVRSRELSGRGMAGCRRFREVLEVWIEDGRISMTKFERELFRTLDAADVPRPTPQYVVKVNGKAFKFDYAYGEVKFGLEAHSRKFHGDDLVKPGDLDRHTLLTVAGYRVMYIRYRDLKYRPQWVVDNVVAALTNSAAA